MTPAQKILEEKKKHLRHNQIDVKSIPKIWKVVKKLKHLR
jgi:hypothetical protein